MAPANLAAEVLPDEDVILVTWNILYGITTYQLQYTVRSSTVDQSVVQANSYRVDKPLHSTGFKVRVAGVTNAGIGVFSEFVQVTDLDKSKFSSYLCFYSLLVDALIDFFHSNVEMIDRNFIYSRR